MKDPRSTVRYLGFQALSDGGRRFDFSFAGPDASMKLTSIEACRELFVGPDHMAIQECAGICFETLKCRIAGASAVPTSISLTAADIARHRKLPKSVGRRRLTP